MSSSLSEHPRATQAGAVDSIEVVMPQMGVSVAEGTLTAWLKQPGETVDADEPVCEVTTDKIDVEIPSPGAGVLAEVVVAEGETVSVGTVLGRLEPPGGAGPGSPNGVGRPERPTSPADRAPAEIDRSGVFSPVVRRIAARHGVDLRAVHGEGVGGRIRKVDLLRHIEAAKGDGNGSARPLHSESPYREEPDAIPPARVNENGTAVLTGPARREPLGPMRRAIAEHMLASRRTSAHCTTVAEADFSAVAAARERRREAMARRGTKLTPLAFVAAATVAALAEHPRLNASIDGDELVLHEQVNLGIAVALDDGLVVPVIRNAERLSLEGLASAIAGLAGKARAGRLEPDDVAGGTFTITNPGQFGAVIATPIINQPQVAILDLEAVTRRPVVVEGPDGSESIGIRPMSYLCMSWDHRALDGADAARFLASVRGRLESPEMWR